MADAAAGLTTIVVSYNAREHLESCLDKLGAQLGAEDEIVVVDNASTDGSPELVARRFPAVRLIALPSNIGFGAANNRGAEVARGERLLLLNPDAWLAEGSLEPLRAALARDPALGAVAPQLYYPDGRPQFTWAPDTGVFGEAIQKLRNPFEARTWNHRLLPALLRRLTGPGWLTAACLLVRRAAFEAIGGFDEEIFLYFEDVDLCRRLRHEGWRLELVAAARAFHAKGGTQGGQPAELEYRRGQLRYYRKHRPRWEVQLLETKLRRKFRRVDDPVERARLLALLG